MSQSTLSRQTTSNLLFPTPSTSSVIPRSKIVCRLLKATNIASRQERNNLNPKTSLPCGIDLCRSHVTLHPLQRQTFSTVAVSQSKTRNVSSCCNDDRDASKDNAEASPEIQFTRDCCFCEHIRIHAIGTKVGTRRPD